MFASLRSQLTLLLVSLLVLLVLVTGYATLSTMRQDSEQQARQILKVSTNVFRQTLQVRSDQLTDSVRLLAADFGFRQAVATAERATINSVLENHGARINANLALLLSNDGQLLATTSQFDSDALVHRFLKARGQHEAFTDIISIEQQAYQIVLVPVRAPHIIAWVGMGFSVDEQLARQIHTITGLEVSFSQLTAGQKRVLSSTLDLQTQYIFSEQSQSLQPDAEQIQVDLPTNYISQAFALDQQQEIWAFLHLPNERWLANYQRLRAQLLQIFSLGLALALATAFIYTRSVTRPLARLVEFAAAIGRGSTTAAPAVKLAEITVLADTLSLMRNAIWQREAQLKEQAERDVLTGLGNRLAIDKQLPEIFATRSGQLLQLNIARFKHVNDSFGYSNGDVLLQQLAKRLSRHQHVCFCARLGADEFLLVLSAKLSEQERDSLLHQLSQPFNLAGSAISLHLLYGCYEFKQGEPDVNKVLRCLDIALNTAKTRGLTLAVYQSGQDESHQRELTIIRDLPVALHSGQMHIVYQPKVDIVRQRSVSAEALIRWQHPQLGYISPVEFILLAERSGNISLITNWMLEKVVCQLACWFPLHPELCVAVNLSAEDLQDAALSRRILALLDQYRLPVTVLSLEVTESAVMQDTVKAISNLQQLKNTGIRLAIDDFGTGQSSLAYLKTLPVHEVKIDRAFVKDIEHNRQDELIVQATARLAAGLGLTVTAEGLENQAGLSRLLAAGCQQVQGYYFSKPLDAEAFSAWLSYFAAHKSQFFNVAADPATHLDAAQ